MFQCFHSFPAFRHAARRASPVNTISEARFLRRNVASAFCRVGPAMRGNLASGILRRGLWRYPMSKERTLLRSLFNGRKGQQREGGHWRPQGKKRAIPNAMPANSGSQVFASRIARPNRSIAFVNGQGSRFPLVSLNSLSQRDESLSALSILSR